VKFVPEVLQWAVPGQTLDRDSQAGRRQHSEVDLSMPHLEPETGARHATPGKSKLARPLGRTSCDFRV